MLALRCELEDVIAPERIGQVLDELADVLARSNSSGQWTTAHLDRRTCGSHAGNMIPLCNTGPAPPRRGASGDRGDTTCADTGSAEITRRRHHQTQDARTCDER